MFYRNGKLFSLDLVHIMVVCWSKWMTYITNSGFRKVGGYS